MRTIGIVQARVGSTRLPGKVLRDLAGEPMLARVVRRLSRATSVDEVWIATTSERGDDVIVAVCEERGWPCVRGSEKDVLDRYWRAARMSGADRIVRITSDCPLTDPEIVDRVVTALEAGVVYSSNVFPNRTFPTGLDAEAFESGALEEAWREARAASDREHVTPFLWRQPDRFPQATVTADSDYSHHRWTVDVPEDYALMRRIYDHFGHDTFGWRDVLDLLQDNPHWRILNAHVKQKST